jgi:hypothetical protein
VLPKAAPLQAPDSSPPAKRSPNHPGGRRIAGSLLAGSGSLDIAPSRVAGQRSTQRVNRWGNGAGLFAHGGCAPTTEVYHGD